MGRAEPHGEVDGNLALPAREVFGVYHTVLSPVLGLENSVRSDEWVTILEAGEACEVGARL